MTLTHFLLARIAEDEADARSVHDISACAALEWGGMNTNDCDCGWPEGVLAECEAKRRIVGLHALWERVEGGAVGVPLYSAPYCGVCADESGGTYREAFPCPTLRILASIYVDHRDYDEAWRP